MFNGKITKVHDIAKALGIGATTLRNRWKECEERGWPEEAAYDHAKWAARSKGIQIKCPDGKYRDLAEVGKLLGVHPETVRGRPRILKKTGESMDELWRKDRWRGPNPKMATEFDGNRCVGVTAEEKRLLDRIPGPSELERRVFG